MSERDEAHLKQRAAWFQSLSPVDQALIDSQVFVLVVGERQEDQANGEWLKPVNEAFVMTLRQMVGARMRGDYEQRFLALQRESAKVFAIQAKPPLDPHRKPVVLDDLLRMLDHLPYQERPRYEDLADEDKQMVDASVFIQLVEEMKSSSQPVERTRASMIKRIADMRDEIVEYILNMSDEDHQLTKAYLYEEALRIQSVPPEDARGEKVGISALMTLLDNVPKLEGPSRGSGRGGRV